MSKKLQMPMSYILAVMESGSLKARCYRGERVGDCERAHGRCLISQAHFKEPPCRRAVCFRKMENLTGNNGNSNSAL